MRIKSLLFIAITSLSIGASVSHAARGNSIPVTGKSFIQRTEINAFIRLMVEKHGFKETELDHLFSRTQMLPAVLKAITPPPPGSVASPSWIRYRERFLSEERIAAGLDFWEGNEAALKRAREIYGVPEEIIVGIIGVETQYGRNMGSFRVIDALTTLAFAYPPRAEFFRAELEQFLLFAREEEFDVFAIKGSYAGAIGIPQFMPSSYRKYGVDFDGDQKVDLRGSNLDAIGSIGKFLASHGWLKDKPVAVQITSINPGSMPAPLMTGEIKPQFNVAEFIGAGITIPAGTPVELSAALIELPTPNGTSEYRLGFQNFYVITRYNRNVMYAAAVQDLAAAIKARRVAEK